MGSLYRYLIVLLSATGFYASLYYDWFHFLKGYPVTALQTAEYNGFLIGLEIGFSCFIIPFYFNVLAHFCHWFLNLELPIKFLGITIGSDHDSTP